MAITISKLQVAIAMLITAVLVPAVAIANADFDDVKIGAFFDEATSWAKLNNITTGSPAGSTTFKPLDPVTRGESVVFLKRYDDNVVQPALESRVAGVQHTSFSDSVTISSTTMTEVEALTLETNQVRDVALTAHVYLERVGSTFAHRYQIELRQGDCAGPVVGATNWRMPDLSGFLADTVTVTGFSEDAPAGTSFSLCVAKSSVADPNVVAYQRGIIANS